jgi:alpha-mannosidase
MPHFEVERKILLTQLNNRLNEIHDTMLSGHIPIDRWKACVTGHRQTPGPPPSKGWTDFAVGQTWGGLDVTCWFKAKTKIPKSLDGQTVHLFLRPGGESFCRINDEFAGGLDANRADIRIAPKARAGQSLDLLLESYSNSRIHQTHTFAFAFLAAVDPTIQSFYWDAKVVWDVVQTLPPDTQDRMRLLELLTDAVHKIDLQRKNDRPAYLGDIRAAQKFLRAGLKPFARSTGVGKLILAGHSHIDTAWLWPLRETKRKCSRTFSTVLKYMDEFPEFRFTQSQPQLYEYVKDHYPDIFKAIKKRVAEGRWEPIGGGWIEQDANMPSGEAMVRQYLYGHRFFKKEFGIDNRTCWLPDAFGYPLSLPQILKKSGIDTFVTTKIDWSQYTKFPYSLFTWKGLDGTEVLSVMPPLNYNGNVCPNDCVQQWNQFKQKDMVDELIFSFGWGDGGGGPTRGMIETGRRLENIVGIPKCEFGTMQDTIDRLHKRVDRDKLPVYHDELYLELHRACQTSQARTKHHNRKCELLYRDAEQLGAIASLHGSSAHQAELYEGWKMLLTNQFHDILPGSSIHEVYEDTERDYAEVAKIGRMARDKSISLLNNKIDTSGVGIPIIVRNTLAWSRTDVVEVHWPNPLPKNFTVFAPEGSAVPAQRGQNADKLVFLAKDVPSLGHAVYRLVTEKPKDIAPRPKATPSQLENDRYGLKLDPTGALTSVFDKRAAREVLAPKSRGNVLQLFDDRPHNHDAWDIDYNIEDIQWEMDTLAGAKVVENGPVRTVLRLTKKTDKSTLIQDVVLHENLDRIDFVNDVDWWEKRVLMKVAFPVDVHARSATYEIQYGAIERPNHFSSEQLRARFEYPGHRWIDLSEGDYGVSLLNDSKYGFDVIDNRMRISLLRAPVSPDPQADEGKHHFTYSLLPHAGDWRAAQTTRRALELNVPLLAEVAPARKAPIPPTMAFAQVDRDHVILDTVKKAEDTDDLIVRLYEAHGQRGPVNLSFNRPIKKAAECNLMEEQDEKVTFKNDTIRFPIRPYEICTFKVTF